MWDSNIPIKEKQFGDNLNTLLARKNRQMVELWHWSGFIFLPSTTTDLIPSTAALGKASVNWYSCGIRIKVLTDQSAHSLWMVDLWYHTKGLKKQSWRSRNHQSTNTNIFNDYFNKIMVTAISGNQKFCLPKTAKIHGHDIIPGATPEYSSFMNDIKVPCSDFSITKKPAWKIKRRMKKSENQNNFQNEEWKSKYILWLTDVKLMLR